MRAQKSTSQVRAPTMHRDRPPSMVAGSKSARIEKPIPVVGTGEETTGLTPRQTPLPEFRAPLAASRSPLDNFPSPLSKEGGFTSDFVASEADRRLQAWGTAHDRVERTGPGTPLRAPDETGIFNPWARVPRRPEHASQPGTNSSPRGIRFPRANRLRP